jgi:hypothetical protein
MHFLLFIKSAFFCAKKFIKKLLKSIKNIYLCILNSKIL